MRLLSPTLALLMALMPALQAYGKTMAEEHCRARGHIAALAVDAAHDPVHAQHHAAAGVDTNDTAHCQCGCVCAAVCTGGAVVPAVAAAASDAPQHEPWFASTDPRHPVAIHEFLLRPPRSLP